MSQTRLAKRLADYQAPSYAIDSIELEFDLAPEQTRVTAISQWRRTGEVKPLVLDGQYLQLEGVWLNGTLVTNYQLDDEQLILEALPDVFELKIVTLLNPAANTALEGLYLSNGAYCTQCEAEGFRRITYYPDRPDMLAVFTTHIIADSSKFPHLLSNGNQTASELLADGRRRVSWFDPFPKPCYLFALVAGDFDVLEDCYQTRSGREVKLAFYVDKGNKSRAEFAMASLKKAMRWDETTYGLEYDLDVYMVVAVDFFNMGAMENKGLNIFNSKYVLADAESATDTDYFHIESIIGHEYFHNWTGNRVTCRDWFQLSLKEGLTVFRDQQFSADMGSPTLCRIDAIKTIRTAQFAEDAGPMAHPIRPEQVLEMNNFYTVTVYDKGAEVIRMQHTLLGAAGFRKGMDLYFSRHDGQAVTCDDFVQAMQDASAVDLQQFRRWYQQAGTPVLSATYRYNSAEQSLYLRLSQHTPATADGSAKLPLVLPVRFELVSAGTDYHHQELLVLKEETTEWRFNKVPADVVPVLLADFSAPVKLQVQYQTADLLLIAAKAQDGVARWDAMQQLWSGLVHQAVEQMATAQQKAVTIQSAVMIPEPLLASMRQLLQQPLADLAFTAELLTLPGYDTLAEQYDEIPVDAILQSLKDFRQQIARALQPDLLACYHKLPRAPYQYSQTQTGNRQLQALCLSYLALSGHDELILSHYQQSDNMTDRLAAIKAAVFAESNTAATMLTDLGQRFAQNPQVFDKWASVQAISPSPAVFDSLSALSECPQFSWTNPNRVRAVYGAFAMQNPLQFHRTDGKGYLLLTQILQKLDRINPQLTARLVTPLLSWKRFDPNRQQLMQNQLQQLLALPELSNDLYEKVSRSLQ